MVRCYEIDSKTMAWIDVQEPMRVESILTTRKDTDKAEDSVSAWIGRPIPDGKWSYYGEVFGRKTWEFKPFDY